MNIDHPLKYAGDATSLLVVASTIAAILPPIAAGLTIIWTLIRIYESRTFQRGLCRITGRPYVAPAGKGDEE